MTDSRNRYPARSALLAFAVGLLVATAVSAGIAGERVTRGAFGASLLANAAATLAALVALFPTLVARRHHPLVVLAPQVAGAIVGVVLVHAFVRREIDALPWLSEKPAQLVNDAVAVTGLLALVWAAARELDARILALALVGVTMYRLTASYWHLDAAVFQTTVQQLVVAELVAAAVALGLFRFTLTR